MSQKPKDHKHSNHLNMSERHFMDFLQRGAANTAKNRDDLPNRPMPTEAQGVRSSHLNEVRSNTDSDHKDHKKMIKYLTNVLKTIQNRDKMTKKWH